MKGGILIKKALSIILTAILFISSIQTASAYSLSDDLGERLRYGDVIYLTQETKAGEFEYFGERIKFKDKNGNELSAEDLLKTGDELVYFDTIQVYTIVLVGDCNNDGKVTASDARIALRISARIDTAYKHENAHGAWDTDFSQKTSATDARRILRYAAKLDNFESFETALKEKADRQNSKEYEYTHDMVMVCMNPEYVNNEEAYTPEFYSDLAEKVEKWITYSETHVWLKIYLKEPSKENVDALFEQCEKHDAIIATSKNVIMYLDM